VRPGLIVAFLLTLLFAACSHADPLAQGFHWKESAPVLYREKNPLTGDSEWSLQYRNVQSMPGRYVWVCFLQEKHRYASCLYRATDDPTVVEQHEEYVGDAT
jgi:hypothetical protein